MPKFTTVGDLKKQVECVDDDALIVVPDVDHSYRPASIECTTLIVEDRGRNLAEDHGDQNIFDEEDYRRSCVVFV